jgi:PQQ-dependent catabolism-associated CXXCW motif protein
MRPRAGLPVGAALAILLAAAPASGEAPSGYRMDDYRAPVPETLDGATVVATPAAEALWRTGRVLFVDVLPRPPRPQGLPEGTIWREAPHPSIPGAIWLPNVGYGELAPVWHGYMAGALAEATAGDTDHPVVFFCLAECWMSWNAARRAREELGYTRVFWYPEGVDGWSAASLPLDEIPPVEPLPATPEAGQSTGAPP